jgi:Ca2+-binding RTX toxin-like protein
MYDNAIGGNDRLSATGDNNTLFGDARSMSGDARGGDDRLIGGTGDDLLAGDAPIMGDAARGGADTFLFAGTIGRDVVFDFRPDDGDVIEVRDYGFDDVGDLAIAVAGGSTVIDIGASLGQTADVDTIRLAGFNDPLVNADFVFT